jgi:hypothetical protein
MRNRLVIALAGVIVGGLIASLAPVGASANHPPDRNLAFGVVRLTGAQEIGPNGEVGVGDADGRGQFAFVAFDSTFCYAMTVRKIDAPVAAHIHAAPRGVNGGIAFFLDTPSSGDGGTSANCVMAEPDTTPNTPMVLVQSELDALIADQSQFYANVHTGTFPAGAIRGQLA